MEPLGRKAARRPLSMHHTHQPSKFASDVRCPICGQGFLVYGDKLTPIRQNESRRIMQQALRDQHGARSDSSAVHPGRSFYVASCFGTPPFSASPLLGDLLDNAL